MQGCEVLWRWWNGARRGENPVSASPTMDTATPAPMTQKLIPVP
jgi:hypothetical protein